MRAVFDDRRDAGRRLAAALGRPAAGRTAVYGLARGGVPVAAEVARALGAPLDVLAVRKIGHPRQPELALGAVAPGGPPFVLEPADLHPRDVAALRTRIEAAATEACDMDERLHRDLSRLSPRGATCVLVDDGLATGATLVAACRWARAGGAARVVAAVPVGAKEAVQALRAEADEVVCPVASDDFWAVSLWYRDFGQISEDEVRRCVRASREGQAGQEGAR